MSETIDLLREEITRLREKLEGRNEWYKWCREEVGPLYPGGTPLDQAAKSEIIKLRSRLAAAQKARDEAREACARIAGRHVCGLTDLPCDGTAKSGSECGCVVASRIAAEIRAHTPPHADLVPDHDEILDKIGEVISRASDEYVGGSCECDDDDPVPYAKLCTECKAGPRYVARAVLAALAEGGKS